MKTAILLSFICASLATTTAAAQETQSVGQTAKKEAVPPEYQDVKDDDKAMDRAVTEARESLGFFLAALKAKKSDTGTFEVKKCFVEGEKAEHIWIGNITWDGKAFHGRVDNKPLEINNTHLGKIVTVTPEDLTDWMYVRSGKLMGGFTMRVLYSRLSPEQKTDFRKEADFSIE